MYIMKNIKNLINEIKTKKRNVLTKSGFSEITRLLKNFNNRIF